MTKANQVSKHGGFRKGAGRPPPLGQATIRKTIRLTPVEWSQLAAIHSSPSQAIRQLIKELQK
jgi:hypothetical protein